MKNNPRLAVGVLITDTHINDKNIDLVKSIFYQTIAICKQHEIKKIFHLGDWFTSRTGQSISVLNATAKIFKEIEKNEIDIHIIPGNHDKMDLDSNESYLDIFSNYKAVHLYSIKGGVSFKDYKLKITMVPFFKNEKYKEIVSEDPNYCEEYTNVLLTHIAVNGVRNNDGSFVESGIEGKTFDLYDFVYVGHYHNADRVDSKVTYIGSAYQANFGEDANKGICFLFDDGSIEQVTLSFPLFRKIELNLNKIKVDSKMLEELEQAKLNDPEDNFRIIITGEAEKVRAFEKSKLIELGFSVEKKSEDQVIEDVKDIEIVNFDSESLKKAFVEFCKSKKISDISYGLEKLKD